MSAFMVGVVAGLGIAIPVGAIAVLIVQVGIRCGFRCAASAGAGAATADLTYSVLAVTGGAALAGWVGSIGSPLRWMSATVLTVIAVRGLRRSRRDPPALQTELPGRREYASTYAKFFGLTIVNPLTVVYFAAVVLGLQLTDDLAPGDAALFAAGAFLASLSWQTLLAGVGATVRHKLPRRFGAGAAMAGNVLVLGMAALIILR